MKTTILRQRITEDMQGAEPVASDAGLLRLAGFPVRPVFQQVAGCFGARGYTAATKSTSRRTKRSWRCSSIKVAVAGTSSISGSSYSEAARGISARSFPAPGTAMDLAGHLHRPPSPPPRQRRRQHQKQHLVERIGDLPLLPVVRQGLEIRQKNRRLPHHPGSRVPFRHRPILRPNSEDHDRFQPVVHLSREFSVDCPASSS